MKIIKKITQKELDELKFIDLIIFHSWYFGYDREHITAQLLEYADGYNDNYTKDAEQNWLDEII